MFKTMTQEFFNELLQRGEGECLDYKEFPYFYDDSNTTKKEKDAEFIKDIISFVNTVRDESAYILIGVKEKDGIGIPVGIEGSESVDSAILQSKIKDKVNSMPKFNCFPFYDESGNRYDIIEIPAGTMSSFSLPKKLHRWFRVSRPEPFIRTSLTCCAVNQKLIACSRHETRG